jgi:hypothetical protein
MKVLFLDIDGVMNSHEKHTNGYTGMSADCVTRLNFILYETDARIVVSSAWRFLVLSGSMKVEGLENLFLTHGINCYEKVIGITGMSIYDPETKVESPSRGELIKQWLGEHKDLDIKSFAVVDDGNSTSGDDFGITEAVGEERFVQTDSVIGLTDHDAMRVIRILNGVRL